jgi:hypothetical protein
MNGVEGISITTALLVLFLVVKPITSAIFLAAIVLAMGAGLVVEEKKYRVANYILTMCEGLFRVASAVGLDSPTKLERGRVFLVE